MFRFEGSRVGGHGDRGPKNGESKGQVHGKNCLTTGHTLGSYGHHITWKVTGT